MQEQVLEYINSNDLCSKNNKIICAVSGGVDSMVLAYILNKLKFNIIVATCNFNLRGEESDKDQALVKTFCDENNIMFRTINFDTKEYAKKNKLSIQMAARDLRFNWFNQLLTIEKADRIAIAHNLNDSIETFFINLSRGTGIKGLTGIKNKNGNIIRPLIFTDRQAIYKYAHENNVPFREDATNAQTKYYRNFIRHKIIPMFEELNPSAFNNFENTISNLQNTEHFYRESIDKEIINLVEFNDDKESVAINSINNSENTNLLLFEWLNPKGFNKSQINDIEKSIKQGISGKIFLSENYKLIRETDKITLQPIYISEENTTKLIIENVNSKIKGFEISIIDRDSNFTISKDKSIAQIDMDKISFPLIIERWKTGDKFQPLGMTNNKLISDFLTDLKIPSTKKESLLILKSNNTIVWIIGLRIDNRFKINESTQKIIQIKQV